jgi:phosphatidate cytidylyltransferase
LNRRQMDRLSHLCLGWLYVPYPLSYVLLLGRGESPRAWIFYVLLVLVAGDAGAYYTGKAIGKHKLNRVVSPNKTIEGSIGGLMASTLVGALYGLLFIDSRSVVLVIFMALALELVGQVGDLIESMLKRMHGKKDSSGLLPGHGGLLDRLDSLLFAFPVTWLIMHL